ncbi:MAG: hypothetical protein IT290_06950 [Deltaproteobacteria bacterium]|nr:hypothetical protein [Deltaproteobacteria bacterium]
MAPEEAGQWMSSGFSAAKASLWAKWQIAPLDASRWLLHNFDSPQEVKLWMRGGFEPQEARVWAERCPLPLESVIQFRKVGFEDADLAYRWSAVLQLPVEAARWHELGFTPDETQEWRELGFFEAHQAYDWKQRGFTPASALREFNS